MTSTVRFTLAKAIDGDTAFEWGDAVSLVQQLVEQLIPDGPGRSFAGIPPTDSIELDATGALYARLEPNAARPAAAALGELLRQLCAGIGRPPALRLFAMRAISTTPPLSLEDFGRELADWAPPNCRERLIHLYQRARERETTPVLARNPRARSLQHLPKIGAIAAVGIVVVFGAVRFSKGLVAKRAPAASFSETAAASRETPAAINATPVVAAPKPPAPVQIAAPQKLEPRDYVLLPEGRPPPPRGSAPEAVGRAGPAAALPVARRPGPPAPPPATAPPVTPPPVVPQVATVAAARSASTAPTRTRPAAVPSGRRETVKPPPVVSGAAENEFRRARELFDRHAYVAAVEGFSRVVQMIPPSENGGPDLRFVAGEYLALSRASLAALQVHVYAKGDVGVSEPVALGQFLPPPPDPGMPQNRLAVLEVTIDAQGNVESARLSGESSQFRTQWWVAAAKAWRFRPAMKDDNPVRFLKRIVLADSKPLEPR